MSVAFPGLRPHVMGERGQEVAQEPVRRVRQEVRDGIAVIAFSATASTVFAVTLFLIVNLVGQAG